MTLRFFSPPKRPANEKVRQDALNRTGALGRGNEAFDALAREAAEALGTPIAAVSLVDRDRQFFLGETGIGTRETARAVSFCAHAIHGPNVFVVPDATDDPRFAGNPLVTGSPPGVRFYAGMPLTTSEGHKLGALCVIDTKSRSDLTADERNKLVRFAERAIQLIEDRDHD